LTAPIELELFVCEGLICVLIAFSNDHLTINWLSTSQPFRYQTGCSHLPFHSSFLKSLPKPHQYLLY